MFQHFILQINMTWWTKKSLSFSLSENIHRRITEIYESCHLSSIPSIHLHALSLGADCLFVRYVVDYAARVSQSSLKCHFNKSHSFSVWIRVKLMSVNKKPDTITAACHLAFHSRRSSRRLSLDITVLLMYKIWPQPHVHVLTGRFTVE